MRENVLKRLIFGLWGGGGGLNNPVVALNVPAGEWDTVRVLESETVMLEMKDGREAIGSEDVLEL